jgi:hypothetical protein
MLEISVNSWPELINAMFAVSTHFGNSKPWWRGQSVSGWDLLPSIHHRGKAAMERNLTFRFKNMAKARHAKCPSNADCPAWLFLMQHYGLPTRLLDWSESPMVAMFFAIGDRKYDNEDAALWALSPTRLNRNQHGEGVIVAADHARVLPIIVDAFVPVSQPTEQILSVLTDQNDIRQLVQQSVFTAHGSKVPINHLHGAPDFVARISIPRLAKIAFREALDLLGVNRSALFPDLGNLADDLADRGFARDV